MLSYRRLPSALVGLLLLVGCTSAPSAPAAKPNAASQGTAAGTASGVAAATPAQPAAVAGGTAETRLTAPVTLKFGFAPLLGSGPIFYAHERGYFEELNVQLDLIRFNSGALMVAPLANGDLDVGSGGISTGLFNALGRDVRLKIVGDGGSSAPGHASSVLMVRKDLWDAGVFRSPQDLRGRRVNFATEASPIDYYMRNLLVQYGLTMDDMEVQRLTSADVLVGFQNGAIEAGMAAEPFPSQIERAGAAVRWLTDGDVLEGTQTGAILLSEKAVTTQPAALRAFMVAYVRAVREWLEADGGRADDNMVAAISKWTTVTPEAIKSASKPYIRPDGRVLVDDLYRQQDFWVRAGVMRERADLTNVVDQSYVEYANRVLGVRQ